MYQPAFTETFVALLAVIVWARWLDDRAPSWARYLPWVAGAGVILGQAFGGYVVFMRLDPGPLLVAGRWIGMGTCALSLLVQAALTVASLVRPGSPKP